MLDDPFLYITTDQLILELLNRSSAAVIGTMTIEGEITRWKIDFKGGLAECTLLCECLRIRISDYTRKMIEFSQLNPSDEEVRD